MGIVDGHKIIVEHRFLRDMPEWFESMATEMVAAKVDVLVGVS